MELLSGKAGHEKEALNVRIDLNNEPARRVVVKVPSDLNPRLLKGINAGGRKMCPP
jgi:hypothetical protein